MWQKYKFDFWILAAGGLVTVIGGLTTGAAAVFLSVFLILYLAWYMACVHRLRQALESNIAEPPRWAVGPFREMFEKLHALRTRSRKRKRRVSRYNKRFREAAAAIPYATVILDPDNAVVWCNPVSADLLDIHWPDASGRSLCALVPSPLLEEWLADGARHSLEFRPPCNEATILSTIIKPFGNKRERLLFARDVTEVYNVDRMRRDFIANLSHELRTPITVISGFLESLADAPDIPESFNKPMSHMSDQAQRMRALVDDLMALSRLEFEDVPAQAVQIDIAALIAKAVADAQVLSAEDKHTFQVNADPQIGLLGNPAELRSAITNLIVNAVRHTQARTEIRISWQLEGSGACLEVRDNGPGIPARHIPRLTEQFYRVDSARSRRTGGTGLGLAIVKRILDRHGAELRITSASGRGSAFACHFPPAIVAPLDSEPSETQEEGVETEPVAVPPHDDVVGKP
jgi:two-component system phosphate regulon sensor histidine kinase PhoR